MDSNVSSWLWRAERVISQGTWKIVLGNVGVLNYWNKITNKEVYVGRVSGGEPFAPRKRLN